MKLSKTSTENLGFTLIELLVVIAIIGILSSVVLASLSGARESAKVTKMASDLQQIETGLVMWMDANGQVKWPTNYNSDSIKTISANTNLSDYLNSVPEPPFSGFGEYQFWNHGNNFTCGDLNSGVILYINNASQEIAEKINKIVDGGNETNPLTCGKIRWRSTSGGQIQYGISNDPTL